MAEISTAVSDLVLAVTAFYISRQALGTNLCFAIGIGLQGLAASVGVARFAQSRPSSNIVQTHKGLSWLTTVLGLSLMSAGSHWKTGSPFLAKGLLLTAVIFTATGQFLSPNNKTLLTKSLSGFSLLSLLCLLILQIDCPGVTACLLYILSGSAIGSEGYWRQIPRIDILHYGLALGNIAFSWSRITN